MNGVVVVVRPEGPGSERWHGQVEEAPVRGRVGHVGREVDGRGIDAGIGGDIRDGGEVVVHEAGVLGGVGGLTVEPRLQDEREEEGARESHVVDVKHVSPEHTLGYTVYRAGLKPLEKSCFSQRWALMLISGWD